MEAHGARLCELQAGAPVTLPPGVEGQAAETLAAARAWAEYDAARNSWETAAVARGLAAESLDGWRKRRAAVGEAPKAADLHVVGQAADQARQRAGRVQREFTTAERALTDALAAVEKARTAPDAEIEVARFAIEAAEREVKALPADDTCPTCERPGWEAAAERKQAAVTACAAATEAFALPSVSGFGTHLA